MSGESELTGKLVDITEPTQTPTMPGDVRAWFVGSEVELDLGSRRIADVESQFEATGYAMVLVELTDAARDSAFASSSAGLRVQEQRTSFTSIGLSNLAQYFVVPPEGQDASLARQRIDEVAHQVMSAAPGRSGVSGRTRKSSSGLASASLSVEADTSIPKVRVFPNLGVMLGTVTRNGLRDMIADPRVAEVQGAPSISLIRPTRTSAASRAKGISWGLAKLGVPEMWNAGFTGKGVLIGHLDTGVDASHPALQGAIKSYAEFDLIGAQITGAPPRDSEEHGTHTAGTIAGRAVGTTRFGVAPDAELASGMVIEGGNIVARILAGLDWTVAQGVQIVSASLGLRGYTPAFLMIARLLRARGILPVIAVGNEGPGTSRSPGNYPEVLSVGASDPRDTVAAFSGSQRFSRADDPIVPDVVAPGVDVLSCIPGGKYAEMNGTSMAAPHIAGLAALLWQATNASAAAIEKAILDSCQLVPGMSPERAGRGLPNAPRAYELLTGTPLVSLKPPAKKAASRKSSKKRTGSVKRASSKPKPRALKRSSVKPKKSARRS